MNSSAWLLVLCLALVLGFPWYQHEVGRWNGALVECRKRFSDNVRILSNTICVDAFQRQSHGDLAEEMCRKAQTENHATPMQCAWDTFWKEGELYALYCMFARSYLMLLALVVPTTLMVIYMVFSTRHQRHMEESRRKERADIVESFRGIMHRGEEDRPVVKPRLLDLDDDVNEDVIRLHNGSGKAWTKVLRERERERPRRRRYKYK